MQFFPAVRDPFGSAGMFWESSGALIPRDTASQDWAAHSGVLFRDLLLGLSVKTRHCGVSERYLWQLSSLWAGLE